MFASVAAIQDFRDAVEMLCEDAETHRDCDIP